MPSEHPDLIVTTGNEIDGYYVAEVLGVVRGIVVRAQSITQGIRGAFANPKRPTALTIACPARKPCKSNDSQ